jgi:hypothetical protein
MKTYTHFFISHSFILRIRNVTDDSFKDYINTHFVFNNSFFKKNLQTMS